MPFCSTYLVALDAGLDHEAEGLREVGEDEAARDEVTRLRALHTQKNSHGGTCEREDILLGNHYVAW